MLIRSLYRYDISGLDLSTTHIIFGLFSLSKHRKLKLELKAESQEGQAELS